MVWALLDHTGDLGLEVTAPALEELFAEALRGFTDCLTEVEKVGGSVRRQVELAAAGYDLLLVDWLEEALFLFETESLVFSRATVEFVAPAAAGGEVSLRSWLAGEVFDPARHPLKAPIKAVTYHALELAAENGSWRAKVVFDL